MPSQDQAAYDAQLAGYIPVDTASGLYYDPVQHVFMQNGVSSETMPNQWAWGDQGLQSLGGSTPLGVGSSFLSILDQYAAGAPITADTWQDAVRQSLTGFVRENYGVDPLFNWNPNSGMEGSQFRMGTFQELANQLPGFFDTSGNLTRSSTTGEIINPGGYTSPILGGLDVLLGLQPQDKLLGFEDIPFQQIEQAIGALPGQFINPELVRAWTSNVQPLEQAARAFGPQREALQQQLTGAKDDAQRAALNQQIQALDVQALAAQQAYDAALASVQSIPNTLSLADLQNSPQYQDFNDLLFKLDINKYAPPPPIIRATPESVLNQFFDTPAYRLAFGNDPGVLDASLDPTERFRFDPGYQFAQTEGLRQLQMDQSKRGLLESGAGMRDIQNYSQGLADQNYQRYIGQNEALFTDWQNRIQGIMGQGSNASSQQSQLAAQLGTLLGGLSQSTGSQLSGISSQIGANLSSLASQTGTNIANMFGNQGMFGSSAFLNTGAAQSSNIMQAATIQAQIAAANAAAQASQQAASNASGGGEGAGQLLGQGLSMLGSFK